MQNEEGVTIVEAPPRASKGNLAPRNGTAGSPAAPVRGTAAAATVAKLAGVSIMTVSRVFNDSALVSEVTRRKVLEAARQIGYQPNLAARALRTGKIESFGFVVASPLALRGEFHSETLAALESIITPRDFGLSITLLPPDTLLGDLCARFAASGRVGALAVRLDVVTPEHLASLSTCGVPVVLANYAPEHAEPDGISTVGFNNSLGTVHAVRHLAALGHRRIAYLGGTPGWVDSLQRKEGFSRGLSEMELPEIGAFIRDTDFSRGYDAGLAEMTDILAGGGAAPTAVVCASDDIAAGAMEAARLWGLQVPRDLSVIGYDDQRWCNFMTPKLTSVRHAGWDLGEHVGRTLLQQFDAPDTPPSHTVLETRLVLRESTAPAPAGQ